MLIVINGIWDSISLPAPPCLNFEEFTIVYLVAGLIVTLATWKQVRWENFTRPPFLMGSM